MKKLLLGGLMLFSGIFGTGLILAGITADRISNNYRLLTSYQGFLGIIIALITFIFIGIIGLLLSVWGLVEKERSYI